MMVAARGIPSAEIFAWIVSAMIGARTSAMGMNRYLDWEIDQKNPRTVIRSQLATKQGAFLLTVFGFLLFLGAVTQLNFLCLILSPWQSC